MGGAVPIGCFQLIAHLAAVRLATALFRYRRPADVATQPFQLVAFLGLGRHPGMQRDKIARSDFEQPKAGPEGEGQDARSNPPTSPIPSPYGSSQAGSVCRVNTFRPWCGPTAIR